MDFNTYFLKLNGLKYFNIIIDLDAQTTSRVLSRRPSSQFLRALTSSWCFLTIPYFFLHKNTLQA